MTLDPDDLDGAPDGAIARLRAATERAGLRFETAPAPPSVPTT